MTTPRGNYAKGLARRQEIVDAALELFARKGYDRTSVREIARQTGLSQAGLLHHFGSKEELFLEVLRLRDRRNEEYYDQGERHRVSIDGLTQIVDHNAAQPGLVRLYVAMSAESTGDDSASRHFFTERYELLRNDIAADIRLRQDAGELPGALDPLGIATLLIAAADGLQIQWLLSPDSIDMGARLLDLTRLLAAPGGETSSASRDVRAEGR
jgi:AcrR family transcriptional regulator